MIFTQQKDPEKMPLAAIGARTERRYRMWPTCVAKAMIAGLFFIGPSLGLLSQIASAQEQTTLLSPDRATSWNPGLNSVGGIPVRETVCASVMPQGEGRNDTEFIQKAIDGCPAGQVVKLAAGRFKIDNGTIVFVNKSITLRGEGAGRTVLEKSDGAHHFPKPGIGHKPSPLIVVGPARWIQANDQTGTIVHVPLAANAVKGQRTVILSDASRFAPGQFVLLDQASGADWRPDPSGLGQVWASKDMRVVWNKHNPRNNEDDFPAEVFPTSKNSAGGWFARLDRPTSEIKQIESINGLAVTFTTPIHISYQAENAAELSTYGRPFLKNAGVENLTVAGADNAAIVYTWTAFCWARGVEVTKWSGYGFAVSNSFGTELREFYVHDSAWVHTGGGSYGIALSLGTSEALVENGIVVRVNKLLVAQAAGAGSVVGYNYMDMAYISYVPHWIETGLSGSHYIGSHHILFEGNYSQNGESDSTHGNSVYHTFFRNHLAGVRARFSNIEGGEVDDINHANNIPKRAVGLMAYSYWMSFVGNVLGLPGQVDGWTYDEKRDRARPCIWLLGWGRKWDPLVAETAVRIANFDFLTKSVRSEPPVAVPELPASLYLKEKPGFFTTGKGYVWPWVDPLGSDKVQELPAKARYDAGTPFSQP